MENDICNLFDDIFDFDKAEDLTLSDNPYIEVPEKGLALVAKLMARPQKRMNKYMTIRKFNKLINDLAHVIGAYNLVNEIKYIDELQTLGLKLYEENKFMLLHDKTIVGVGGKFSAGKSQFINSLIAEDILPQDQNPVTSIPSYIVKSRTSKIRAFTYDDKSVGLELDEAKALTHEFYDKYKIGFSPYVNNLVFHVPEFPFSNMAILDTPGYSKDDTSLKQDLSDHNKAHEQLKSVDFVIWLVDIENGTIVNKDIEFIKTIGSPKAFLVVFNKADKLPESNRIKVVEESKNVLKQHKISCYDVIAYSSIEAKEYLGSDSLKSFLKEANQLKDSVEDIASNMLNVMDKIDKDILRRIAFLKKERDSLGDMIFRSEDVLEIKSLTLLYGEHQSMLLEYDVRKRYFKKISKEIRNLLISIKVGSKYDKNR